MPDVRSASSMVLMNYALACGNRGGHADFRARAGQGTTGLRVSKQGTNRDLHRVGQSRAGIHRARL